MSFLDDVRTITEARGRQYGPPVKHFTKTVGMINALYDLDLTPEDWAVFMICDKLARESETVHRDNLLDIAGYAERREEILRARGEAMLEGLDRFTVARDLISD